MNMTIVLQRELKIENWGLIYSKINLKKTNKSFDAETLNFKDIIEDLHVM